MKKTTYIILASLLITQHIAFAQTSNNLTARDRVITTAVPFLHIPGDARSSGMANIGVATPAGTYAQQWNPAKYAFIENQQGIGISYVPYLRKLANDINLGQINYYNRINERSAFAGSLRYFSLGEVTFRQTPTDPGQIYKPNQLALDISYALRLSETYSMAVTGRYIRSDLKLPSSPDDASPANSVSVGISGFYQSHIIPYNDFDGRWRAGFNISNIGPKIKYSDNTEGNFLPTNLSIGGGFDFIFDQDNTVGAYVQFNKLLVPTPSDSNGDGAIDRTDDYYSKDAIGGMFSSFGDAPGGFKEELQEVTWAIGGAYRYRDVFAFRLGYYHENLDKGFQQFLTLGAGFKYSIAKIDISYLFSTAKAVKNPLEGGLRFSLSFRFGKRDYQEF